MGRSWDAINGGGLLSIALVYAALFTLAGRTLWKNPSTRTPGGLLFTLAVCMAPIAIYDFEHLTGLWAMADPGSYSEFHPKVHGSWIVMEVGTIVVAYITLRFVRFPFLVAPLAYALWFLSMDLAPLLFGKEWVEWQERQWISLWFGLAMLLVAFLVDRRSKNDFAFWLYLFGMLAFWGGLSSMNSGSEWGKAIYCAINLTLMVVSLLLQRWVFIVFGGIGVTYYLGHLAFEVFKDSILFSFSLTLLGLFVMFLGVLYRRHHGAIEQAVLATVPDRLRTYLLSKRTPKE